MDTYIEISGIDLRYERCRLRHGPSEKRLFRSIADEGVREPLLGLMKEGRYILLDGFKRLRCAKKLSIASVPFQAIAEDEPQAVITLIRRANATHLTLLEQACLIDDLTKVHGLSIKEISHRLERSTAWVSVRRGVLEEMPVVVREQVMKGRFPLYVYMYQVRQFMRINKAPPAEVEEFVESTAGKDLTAREIGMLAGAFFRGGEKIKQQITDGNLGWCLDVLRNTDNQVVGCTEDENRVLADLDLVVRRMKRLVLETRGVHFKTAGFFAQAQILCDGILSVIEPFTNEMRGLYDRSRSASSDCGASREGHGHSTDCTQPGD